jgi:peptide/nickel transport system permease protein
MLSRQKMLAIALTFGVVHAGIVFAGFFAPYAPSQQHRQYAYAPPTRLHFLDTQGHIHFRPFVYRSVPVEAEGYRYAEDRKSEYSVRFLIRKQDGLRLMAVDPPADLFLLGTDGYGRDIFSRVLFGGRISLLAAAVATLLSLLIGVALGGIAGHFGGAVDTMIMRGSELVLALPWIYLLLAIRAALPLNVDPPRTLLLLSAVIGVMGWARPARLIRGVVLSAKERPFVTAARGFGASEWYLLRRHVLPQTLGIVTAQAVTLIPQFVAAEATLSFLGLGIGEPIPSWGNMLSAFQQFQTVSSYWWMAFPLVALVAVSLTYFVLADALHHVGARINSGQSYA